MAVKPKRKKQVFQRSPRVVAKTDSGDQKVSRDKAMEMVEVAVDMRAQGYTLRTIAKAVQEKFDLLKAPDISTVFDWIEKARNLTGDYLAEQRKQFYKDALVQLDRQLEKFAPIACIPNLQVMTFKVVEGQRIPVVEEDAVEIQLKAGQLVVKLFNQKAAILGIGKNIDGGDQPKETLQMFVTQISNFIHGSKGKEGEVIDIPGERLELEAGVEHIDSL